MTREVKVLVVSPAAFLPDWQGSRKRVRQMVEVMEGFGFEVHFMFVRRSDQLDADSSAMTERLEGRFVELPDKKAAGPYSAWFWRIKLASKLGFYKLCNIDVDSWYFDEIADRANTIVKREKIDIVLLEYQYYSKLFERISGVVKIVDMHDVFADRYKEFLRNGKRPAPWYSVCAEDEAKAIHRADVVLAIQDGDAEVFRSYGHPQVLSLPYAPAPYAGLRRTGERLRICFLGTGNSFNRCALDAYLRTIHPALLKAGVDNELVVMGAVCDAFRGRQVEGRVRFLGKVDRLQDELAQCDALVNSLASGTGLPIKVLDALSCGLHVLATDAGARGLPMRDQLEAVRICDGADDWVEAAKSLAQQKRAGIDLAAAAFRDLKIIRGTVEQSSRSLYAAINARLVAASQASVRTADACCAETG